MDCHSALLVLWPWARSQARPACAVARRSSSTPSTIGVLFRRSSRDASSSTPSLRSITHLHELLDRLRHECLSSSNRENVLDELDTALERSSESWDCRGNKDHS